MALIRPVSKSGFTILEFLLVLGIVAILAVMAIPALMSIVPSAQLRSSARSVLSLMQRARLLAENTQKPARVSLDCRASNALSIPPCLARLHQAVFKPDGSLDGENWAEIGDARRAMAREMEVTATGGAEATGNPAGLFWAVFLPDGRVTDSAGRALASHNPFSLTFSRSGAATSGWELTLNLESGNASLKGLE
jgi:prepilin-type N-terminal cleavage/methylation domain-containing protein